MAFAVPLVVVLATVLLWCALLADERAEGVRVGRLVADHVRDELGAGLTDDVRALSRMAKRWETAGRPLRTHWEADARQLVRDSPDLQAVAWVTPALKAGWVEASRGNGRVLNLGLLGESRAATAILRARDTRLIAVTRPMDLVQGGKGFVVYVPIFRNDRFEGLIVGAIRFQAALTNLPAAKAGQTIALMEGGLPVATVGKASAEWQQGWGREVSLDLYDARWTLRVTPDPLMATRFHSPLLAVVLASGLLTAALVAALLLALEKVRRTSVELRDSETKFRMAIDTMQEGIVVRDRQSRIVVSNERGAEILGLTPEQFVGHEPFDPRWRMLHEDGASWAREEWPSYVALRDGTSQKDRLMGVRFPSGETVWLSVSAVPLFHEGESQPYSVVTTFSDVTVRRRREERTRRQIERANDANAELAEANARLATIARTDALTDLRNRLAFEEGLAEAVSSGGRVSLIMLDVDQFKAYNDRFGHPEGDEALRQVARVLSSVARPGDLPARYGGEEFALLLPETGAEEAVELAERLRVAIEEAPWEHRTVTASLGVATLREGDAERLVAEADAALYRAKGGGRNQVRHAERGLIPA